MTPVLYWNILRDGLFLVKLGVVCTVASKKESADSPASRSRAHPLIDLKTACGLLRSELAGMGELSRGDLASRLGYRRADGGNAARKLAALGHYGLIQRESGAYVLSERGSHMQSLPSDSTVFRRLLRNALEEPVLFRRILEYYIPLGRIPAPAELAPVLTGDRFGITRTASTEAAEVFWRSAVFAEVVTNAGDFVEASSEGKRVLQQSEDEGKTRYPIPLPQRRFAYLEMPAEFDREDISILTKLLDGLVEGLRANVGLGQVHPIEARSRSLKGSHRPQE